MIYYIFDMNKYKEVSMSLQNIDWGRVNYHVIVMSVSFNLLSSEILAYRMS